MTEVIDGQWHLITNFVAHGGDIVTENANADIGDLNAGELVHNLVGLQHAWRRDDCAGDITQQANPNIHFQEFKALLHAVLETAPHLCAILNGGGVRVAEHFVPKFAAGQLVGRHAISLTRQIKERHLYTTDPTSLATMKAKLFNFAEDLIDVAWVFPHQMALEQQRIGLASPITHFSITNQALIGINANNRDAHRDAGQIGNAHVGNLEVRRA